MDDQEVAVVVRALDSMTTRAKSGADIAQAVIEALDEHRAAHPLPRGRPGRDQIADLIGQALFSPASGPVVWTDDKAVAANKQAYRLADAILALPPAVSAEGVKMLVDQDWLRRKIETDPDIDCEAGNSVGPPSAEDVARVIDPRGWERMDKAAAVTGLRWADWDEYFTKFGLKSLAKARTILALFTPAPITADAGKGEPNV